MGEIQQTIMVRWTLGTGLNGRLLQCPGRGFIALAPLQEGWGISISLDVAELQLPGSLTYGRVNQKTRSAIRGERLVTPMMYSPAKHRLEGGAKPY